MYQPVAYLTETEDGGAVAVVPFDPSRDRDSLPPVRPASRRPESTGGERNRIYVSPTRDRVQHRLREDRVGAKRRGKGSKEKRRTRGQLDYGTIEAYSNPRAGGRPHSNAGHRPVSSRAGKRPSGRQIPGNLLSPSEGASRARRRPQTQSGTRSTMRMDHLHESGRRSTSPEIPTGPGSLPTVGPRSREFRTSSGFSPQSDHAPSIPGYVHVMLPPGAILVSSRGTTIPVDSPPPSTSSHNHDFGPAPSPTGSGFLASPKLHENVAPRPSWDTSNERTSSRGGGGPTPAEAFLRARKRAPREHPWSRSLRFGARIGGKLCFVTTWITHAMDSHASSPSTSPSEPRKSSPSNPLVSDTESTLASDAYIRIEVIPMTDPASAVRDQFDRTELPLEVIRELRLVTERSALSQFVAKAFSDRI